MVTKTSKSVKEYFEKMQQEVILHWKNLDNADSIAESEFLTYYEIGKAKSWLENIFCSAPVRCWMWTWTRVLMWYSSMRWRRPERYPSGRSWNGFDKSWEGWTGAPAAMPIIGGPGWKEPCLQSKPGSPERETAPAFQRNGLKSGSCSFRFSTAESDFPYCPNRSRKTSSSWDHEAFSNWLLYRSA